MTETLSLNEEQVKADTPETVDGASPSEDKPFVVDRQVSRKSNKQFAEQRIGDQRDKYRTEADSLGNENAAMTVEMARLKAENEILQARSSQSQTMPTMAQFDNDAEQFQAAIGSFYQNQTTGIVQQQLNQFQANQTESNQNVQIDSAINSHYDRAQDFGKKDYNEAESSAKNIIGEELVKGIMQNTQNSEQILYMLGNDSARASALANMTPLQATMEIGRLSAQAGSYTKEQRPDPEDVVEGGKAPSVSNANLQKRYDSILEKAMITGGNLEELKAVKKEMRDSGML